MRDNTGGNSRQVKYFTTNGIVLRSQKENARARYVCQSMQSVRYRPRASARFTRLDYMTTHYMKLNREPFEKIKSGAKIYELRLYDEKRKKICVGDLIEFAERDGEEKCTVKVTDLCLFDSFEELYATLPSEQCGYAVGEKANPADMEAYYTKEEQRLYGVVAIKTELIK